MNHIQKEYCRITAAVNKDVSTNINVSESLKKAGIPAYSLMTGRTAVLKERSGLLGAFLPGRILQDSPLDIISFWVDLADEDSALAAVAVIFGLDSPGRGSVFSEEVVVHGAAGLYIGNHPVVAEPPKARMLSNLTGISCIVQRGEGDQIARAILESGICAPMIYFGEGTGVRDKLGILRITIPAEKEVVNLITGSNDAPAVLDMLVDAGRLDQPGKGFIYLYNVKRGLVDMRVSIGTVAHAASMDQVIFTLDELTGGTLWRRKGGGGQSSSGAKSGRRYLSDLIDMSFICDEGRSGDLVTAAMAAGAAGATISKFRFIQPADAEVKASPARERCNLIIGESQVTPISEALEKAGLYNDKTHGQILARCAPRACTYLGK